MGSKRPNSSDDARSRTIQIAVLLAIISISMAITAIILYGGVAIQQPSNGYQPNQGAFGNIATFAETSSCTVVLYLNSQTTNSTITYGTTSNYTAVFTATTSGKGPAAPAFTYRLYVNGTLVATSTTSTNPTGSTTLNNILLRSANKYIVTANSSGGSSNCAIVRQQIINKATPTITLTAKPGNFTYNGTHDTITGSSPR